MSESNVTLSLLLKRAEQAVLRQMASSLEAEGLTPDQWQILDVLLDNPGQTMSEVAEAAVVPPATLTRLVDKLVERALVIRRIDAEDRRRTVVALSRLGDDVARRLRAHEDTFEAPLRRTLGADLRSHR